MCKDRYLEAESIYILRGVVAEFSNPVMMYSYKKNKSLIFLLLACKRLVLDLHLHQNLHLLPERLQRRGLDF